MVERLEFAGGVSITDLAVPLERGIPEVQLVLHFTILRVRLRKQSSCVT